MDLAEALLSSPSFKTLDFELMEQTIAFTRRDLFSLAKSSNEIYHTSDQITSTIETLKENDSRHHFSIVWNLEKIDATDLTFYEDQNSWGLFANCKPLMFYRSKESKRHVLGISIIQYGKDEYRKWFIQDAFNAEIETTTEVIHDLLRSENISNSQL